MSEIHSQPYRPTMACERCVFGSGEHAGWCENQEIPWMGKRGRLVLDERIPKNEVWFVSKDSVDKLVNLAPEDPYMADILEAGRDL